MTLDAYRHVKSGGGKLKFRARAIRAEQGEDGAFEAAVLLREAARAEERALRLLQAPDVETRLGAAVERCGCLVGARAPNAASLAWGEVLNESDAASPEIVRTYRQKLDPAYDALQRAFRRAIDASPVLKAARLRWAYVADQASARAELEALVAQFPGDFDLAYMLYQAGVFTRDHRAAWAALAKARQLEPENYVAWGAELLLAPRVLPLSKAEAHLEAAYSQLRRLRGDVDADSFLCFAVASLLLAGASKQPKTHHARALEAAELGVSARSDLFDSKPDLRVARDLAADLVAGRPPSINAFYRAGRGKLVDAAPAKDRNDPVRIFTGSFAYGGHALPSAA